MTSIAYAGLWIFVFAVPWERLVVLPGLNIVTRVTGALALVLTVLAIVINGRVRRWRTFHVAAFLFVLWTGMGVWFLRMGAIPNKYFTFVQLFAVLWMIWELVPTVKRLRGLLVAYVLGACVPALATIALYLKEGDAMRRFSAGGADANSLGMTLALGVPIAWYLSITSERPILRWIGRGYLPLGLFATALTGSRGGLIALMVSLLIIPLTMSLSPGRLAAAVGLLGLSGALMVAYVPERVVERLSTTSTEVEDLRLGGRFAIWMAGVHAFEQQPMMGYGVGGFVRAVTPELGSGALVAHNSFLSVLVEEGLVGLWLYMTMFLSVFAAVRRLSGLEGRFALVLYATLFTAMSPLTWEDQKAVWFIMAALVAMSALYAGAPGGTVRQAPLRRTVPVGRRPVAARP
jgi:O-antigen ligase/polysaccharide polymerase Wzy-like membrane protein